ncbi:type IV secretory system conjugative DNA transfer family protein [Calditrichota bacterium]
MIHINENKITYFAETNFRNQQRKFGIRHTDRRYHFYVLGKTGMGKTTLLENLILSDVLNGNGIAVVDPHGDLIERLLDRMPSFRLNDIIYFNPADTGYPLAFNVLESGSSINHSVLVSGILSVFKKLYQEFWGPRMEHVFRNTLMTVLQIPGSTLFTVIKLLTDMEFREHIVERLQDSVLQEFWQQEYNRFDKRQRTEVISPILNKIGQFLTDPLIRNIVGQRKNNIPFRQVLDNNKILLVNLSKGNIGEDNSTLLGSLILTKLHLAALSRSDIKEERRKDFYLYIDECHNFLTESVASMLAEMRKYRLNLILANQHLDQLDEKIRSAILGNVGTLVVFRVGAFDAEILKEEYFPKFNKVDFLKLPKYQIYLRLMINGVVSEGFSANTLPPQNRMCGNRDKIINMTRERYGKQIQKQ